MAHGAGSIGGGVFGSEFGPFILIAMPGAVLCLIMGCLLAFFTKDTYDSGYGITRNTDAPATRKLGQMMIVGSLIVLAIGGMMISGAAN